MFLYSNNLKNTDLLDPHHYYVTLERFVINYFKLRTDFNDILLYFRELSLSHNRAADTTQVFEMITNLLNRCINCRGYAPFRIAITLTLYNPVR
jgi:hypothetical protein